jgi:hypothetical protein
MQGFDATEQHSTHLHLGCDLSRVMADLFSKLYCLPHLFLSFMLFVSSSPLSQIPLICPVIIIFHLYVK